MKINRIDHVGVIRHIAFAVEDIEVFVAKLKKKFTEIFSEVQQYEEGIILELAEEIKEILRGNFELISICNLVFKLVLT